MKTLPPEFTKNGFIHRQIERQSNVAIFERRALQRHSPECPPHSRSHFEVILIRISDPYQIAEVQFDAREVYPSSEHWGKLAFTCTDLQSARAKAAIMRGSISQNP